MNKSEMRITRLTQRSVSWVQIHDSDIREVAPLAARFRGGADAGHASTAGPRAYSIGPAEWLLIDHSSDEIHEYLRGESGRVVVRVTDVSGAFTSLRIEGAAARAVLASLGDTWATATAEPGQYVRTRLGAIEVVLHCVGRDTFEVHVDRTLAEHLEAWLSAQHKTWIVGTKSGRSVRAV